MRKLLLGALAALILFSRLGDGHLANYDDCYYAEKAKEMLHSGDWLTPHFAGAVRLDNPPLFLWLVAAGFKLFGMTNYGAAFFSALAGLLSVLMLVRLARRLRCDEFTAWGAGVVLLTTQYFLKYAQHAMMDVVLTLFFLVALDGYLSGIEGRRRGWVQLGVATGLGILMKSVLGFFPLIVVAVHRLTVRRFRAVAEPGLWIAGLMALAIGAPWFAYQFSIHGDQLVSEHFRWLIWGRGFVERGGEAAGSSPFAYLARIGTVYWPWLPFALGGLWLEGSRVLDRANDSEERSSSALILLWLVVVLGTMSLGHVKKFWYVMSVFPCLALLSARAAGRLIVSENARRRTVSWAYGVLVLFAGIVALTPIGGAHQRDPDLQRMTGIVRATVPAGEKVLNLDAPYWDVANQFLFYSEHDLTEPLVDPALVREGLRRGGWALIDARRVADVSGPEPNAFAVVAQSGRWALIKAAPAPPIVVQ